METLRQPFSAPMCALQQRCPSTACPAGRAHLLLQHPPCSLAGLRGAMIVNDPLVPRFPVQFDVSLTDW